MDLDEKEHSSLCLRVQTVIETCSAWHLDMPPSRPSPEGKAPVHVPPCAMPLTCAWVAPMASAVYSLKVLEEKGWKEEKQKPLKPVGRPRAAWGLGRPHRARRKNAKTVPDFARRPLNHPSPPTHRSPEYPPARQASCPPRLSAPVTTMGAGWRRGGVNGRVWRWDGRCD